MPSILILNGPNLNLLGTRQPEVYGRTTLADVEASCREAAARLGVEVAFLQTNHEGVLLDAIHGARGTHDAIIINAGAWTHTSLAIADALASVALPAVEVHLSNIHAREAVRHHSFVAPVAIGQIAGLRAIGYTLAIEALAHRLGKGAA